MAELAFRYVLWHYSRGIVDLLRVWSNFLWFFYHFFSIPLLLRTLFSPFQRLDESYKKGLDLEAFFTTLGVNIIMRIIGAMIRLFMIALGVLALLTTLAIGAFFFVAWILSPLVVAALFSAGTAFMLS
jgi:hypothetical protein